MAVRISLALIAILLITTAAGAALKYGDGVEGADLGNKKNGFDPLAPTREILLLGPGVGRPVGWQFWVHGVGSQEGPRAG